VETALLKDGEFRANFIGAAQRIGPQEPLQPIRFRKTFELPKETAAGLTARLYVTAMGVFDVYINGKIASTELLAPGWTSYNHRLAYRTLNVSSLLQPGSQNVLCAEVAEGWHAGRLGFAGGKRFRWGNELAIAAQLELTSDDSPKICLLTDDSWLAMESALVSSEFYDGEFFDARKETEDWNTVDASWPETATTGTKILPPPKGKLVSLDAPPVRVTENISCKEVFRSKSGKVVLDFGQNLVGKLHIPKLDLPEGHKVTFTHTEVLEQGEVATRPLRIAKCADTIVGNGAPILNWTPKFTFHGFRYVQIEGWPTGEPDRQDIEALVIHSDMRRRGFFNCSNPHVNQLHSNAVWSMRGNFVSIPTDCPQRDERLGWTGDLQAFCPTASFLYDTTGVVGSWLEDVAAEQLNDGKYGIPPLVVPYAMDGWPEIPQAGRIITLYFYQGANKFEVWDDVTVLAPQTLYNYSSDRKLLERQFESMRAWIDHGVERASDGLWNPESWQLADWLDPSAPPEHPDQGRTDSIMVANSYLVHVTLVLASLCAELGESDLASQYAHDGKELLSKFQRRYISPEGNLTSSSQTGLSLAIRFNLYPEDEAQRSYAATTLDRLIRKEAFHIGTGFAGTPIIAHALTAIGRPQLAYRMLLETSCPSWLYPVVSHQATTMWERWDSMKPDGTVNPGEMTSFNHYSFGAIADWLHASVGGISHAEPGWRKIIVRPVPGGNIFSAEVSFDGPYGMVACSWTLKGKVFRMSLTVPPNCEAIVTLPSELKHDWGMSAEPSRIVMSGMHQFECEFVPDTWPPKPLIGPVLPPPENAIAE
jgi:alpha-L-rhamnosidase